MEERFPMNISSELFETWKKLKRKGDPGALCKALELSRPVIDRALNYGHVKNEKNDERISKFFAKRLEAEKLNPTPAPGKNSQKLIEAISE